MNPADGNHPVVEPSAGYVHFEKLVAEALRSPDPAAALRAGSTDERLTRSLQQALARVDERGVRMAALLVARLRFERLVQGSQEAAELFDDAPDEFARTFRAYHRAVAPRALQPADEAHRFAAWLQDRASSD